MFVSTAVFALSALIMFEPWVGHSHGKCDLHDHKHEHDDQPDEQPDKRQPLVIFGIGYSCIFV